MKIMRSILLTACLGALFLLGNGCNKGNSSPAIAGTWEIRSSMNGMMPEVMYTPGNDSLLTFTNTRYSRYSKGQLVKSGVYSIVPDNSFNTMAGAATPFTRRIIFDGEEAANRVFLHISHDTLTLVSGDAAVDGGSTSVYKKQ